ncbi:MAG: hypothetical protein HY000_09865 [Planctomycetes bacterium]|nr:hypothetical protein [Planctomycetota bacterium]
MRNAGRWAKWTLVGSLVVAMAWLVFSEPSASAVLNQAPAPLPQPPEGQTYLGAKQCAACHFDQYLKWRQTKHAKGFEIVPARYRADASCLKCHTTGHGEPTGYTGAATPELVGTSCEACHGPGSKHAEIAKGFGTKKLDAAEQAYVRSTTHKILPGNACTHCHLAQGHQVHPPYNKQ